MRIAALFLLLASACASSRVSITGDVKYQKTAEENYQAGVEELDDKNYLEAVKFLEHVRNKFPYSKYATLAELKLADAKFVQEKFIEAAEAYKAYVKLHPNHEQTDYAAFRVGLSYFKEAPAGFFLFPPAYEKDQTQIKNAVTHLSDFVKVYPQSKHLPEAQKTLAEASDRLAEHEWYAAQFYRKRNRWPAVVGRLDGLVRDFPNTKHEADALYQLAEAHGEMKERFRAQQTLQRFIAKFPNDKRRGDAEKQLAKLR